MLKILKSLIVIVGVSAIASGATGAYFTDSETVASNSIQSGTFALNFDSSVAVTPINILNMKPGDGMDNSLHYRWILKNDGSIDMKYRIKAVVNSGSGNALYNQIRFKLGEYSSEGNKDLGSSITLAQLESGIVIDDSVIPTASDTQSRRPFLRPYLPTTAGNEVQGLNVNFNIQFEAIQTNDSAW